MSISDRASRAQAWEHSHFSGRAEWLAWLGHSEGWGGMQSHWGRGKHRVLMTVGMILAFTQKDGEPWQALSREVMGSDGSWVPSRQWAVKVQGGWVGVLHAGMQRDPWGLGEGVGSRLSVKGTLTKSPANVFVKSGGWETSRWGLLVTGWVGMQGKQVWGRGSGVSVWTC